MKASDFNMYWDESSQCVVLEVYGLIQENGLPELVDKLYFASYESARYYILKTCKRI